MILARRRYGVETQYMGRLAVSPLQYSGSSPNRTNFVLYNIADWSILDVERITTSDLLQASRMISDENYVYAQIQTATNGFRAYDLNTSSVVSSVATLSFAPNYINQDETYVYLSSASNIARILKADLTDVEYVPTNYGNTNAIGLDDLYIYRVDVSTNPDTVYVLNKSDMSLNTSFTIGSNMTAVTEILTDANNIYISGNGSGSTQRLRVIRRSDFANITNTQYTSSNIVTMTQDDDYVYFGAGNGEFRVLTKSTRVISATLQTFSAFQRVVNDTNNIYLLETNSPKLRVVPKSDLTTLVSGTPTITQSTFALCLVS